MAVNILTIDVDYIAHHYNSLMEPILGKWDYTEQYWSLALTESGLTSHALVEDVHNVRYIFSTFLKYALDSENVVFGYFHDSILNHIDLDSSDKLNIVNIDQHHDIYYGSLQKHAAEATDRIFEANWVIKLQDRIDNYLWVHNPNSTPFEGVSELPFNFHHGVKENIGPLPEHFNLVYVTMSPKYLANKHWHYYWLMKDMYEELTKVSVPVDKSRYTKIMEDFE